MKLISQRDLPQANVQLGSSNKTIGTDGCLVTCLAMIMDTAPEVVNSRLLQVGGYQDGNLVIWKKIEEAFPGMTFDYRYKEYDGAAVSAAIIEYGYCLVEVDANPLTVEKEKHWVVYLPGGRENDPWTGRENFIDKYNPTGFAVIHGKWSKEMDAETLRSQLAACQMEQIKNDERIEDCRKTRRAQAEQITQLSTDLKDCQDHSKNVEADNKALFTAINAAGLKTEEEAVTTVADAQTLLKGLGLVYQASLNKGSAMLETLKEPARILVLGFFSYVVSDVLQQVAGLPVTQTTLILTLVLKAADKFLHEYAKQNNIEFRGTTLKGLLPF